MWVFLNDCFLSIVHKDCARDELLVRARREGDLEKVFEGVEVRRTVGSDYLFRAVVKRAQVEQAMVGELRRVSYSNFKASVQDKPLHDAYLRVWTDMAKVQPVKPYSRQAYETPDFDSPYLFNVGDTVTDDHGFVGKIVAHGTGGKKKRKRRAKLSSKGR